MKGAFVIALVAACYHPTVASDVPCSASGECPDGQTCDKGRNPPTCVSMVSDGGAADATDAPPDAPPQCTTSAECAATAPICDAATHVCRGCTADVDCAPVTGGACTEYDGRCVADADTIYVSASAGMDSGTCTSALPCATFGYALGQLTATRRTVAVDDGAYPGQPGSSELQITDTGGRIVISGKRLDYTGGATLSASGSSTSNPPVVQTNSGTDVVIEGITVANGGNDGIRPAGAVLLSHVDVEGNNSRGFNGNPQSGAATHLWSSRFAGNGQEGVYSQNAPLEILRCVIVDNASSGVSFRSGALTMISTIVAGNGGSTAGSNQGNGGLFLQMLGGRAPMLMFDTIADNFAKGSTTTAGLNSDNTAAVAISNSIVTGNTNQGANPPQICASCTATYSLFSGTMPIGMGNIMGAPAFASPPTFDYHITAASAARSAADANATLHYDVDDEFRPQGAYDMGADEIP